MNFEKLPYGVPFNLSDYIAVKPQLVISKNVCAKNFFDMTLYSFGEGEGITWQTIPGDILLFVLEGEVFLETKENGRAIGETASVGKCIFVRGGDEFQVSGNKPYKMTFMAVNNIGGNDMFIKNFEHGKVVTLKDQISVESGTIVSKTLVNSDAMTMTIFAFDKGQGVSTHSAPGDAFVVCLEGKAEVELDGQKLTVSEGESLIMSANAPHALKAIEPYKMLLTVVKK